MHLKYFFSNNSTGDKQQAGPGILPVLIVVLLISFYPIIRYSSWWSAGSDTVNFTGAIRSVFETGELAPQDRQAYPNGFAYQALSVFVLNLTGLELPDWQVYGAVFMIVWLAFPAWLLYRQWTGSSRGAALAVVLLFTQPELVFGIMRGTHEKFTRGLILLGLYFLTYSLTSSNRNVRYTGAVIAFYITTFALVTFNNLFSTSFILAVLLALIFARFVARWKGFSTLAVEIRGRIGYLGITMFLFVFLYFFYAYEPAQGNLLLLRSIFDRLAILFLEVQPEQSFNPYTGPVFQAWVSPYVFFILSMANWLLIVSSGLIWGTKTFRWMTHRSEPEGNIDILQWAFYAAFALQGIFTIFADVSGALSGNLQHRLFPTISMVSAPLIAVWLVRLVDTQQNRVGKVVRSSLWAVIGLLSFLALLKATNDPVVSNNWQIFLPAEMRAIEWSDRHLAGRSIWTGFDRRLIEAVEVRSGNTPRQVILDRLDVDPETDNFLVSELILLQVPRLEVSLPTRWDDFVTYDNGQAEIYHRRPRTPYQK